MSAPWPQPPAETPEAVDASCRWPVVCLFVAAAKWLAVATLLGLLASLRFHQPALWSDLAWLTYGRVQPAQMTALIYGFGIQAGLGSTLWILARLGRAPLALRTAALAGTALWNIGLLLGVVGILGGGGSGYESFDLPPSVLPVLFVAYALVGISALVTFKQRRERELYPSQWFLLAAVFWFPWIYSTAAGLLGFAPVRGIQQSVVAWWYASQLLLVWFGFVGLGVLFYLAPKLAGRPLHSRHHALLAFWALVLFSGWRGIPQSAPVPAWMPNVGTVFSLFSIVPLVAVGLNLQRTLAGRMGSLASASPLGLVVAGGLCYLGASLAGIAATLPGIGRLTDFTWFTTGRVLLFLYGFFGLSLTAAFYHILPRLCPILLPSRGLVRAHIVCVLAGALLQSLPLLAGGVAVGRGLADPSVDFLVALKPGLMAFRLSTLGDLLLLVGAGALNLNLLRGGVALGRATLLPGLAQAFKPVAEESR